MTNIVDFLKCLTLKLVQIFSEIVITDSTIYIYIYIYISFHDIEALHQFNFCFTIITFIFNSIIGSCSMIYHI